MTDEALQVSEEEQDLPEQIAIRLAKRERLIESGAEAYPVSLSITHTIDEVKAKYPDLEIDVATGDKVALAGRVMFQRNTGKLCFATLRAGDGTEIQAMLSLANVGEDQLANWKDLVDIGDHVFADLRNPARFHGWWTGAIIRELEKEIAVERTPAYQALLFRMQLVEEIMRRVQWAAPSRVQSSVAALLDELAWRGLLFQQTEGCAEALAAGVA